MFVRGRRTALSFALGPESPDDPGAQDITLEKPSSGVSPGYRPWIFWWTPSVTGSSEIRVSWTELNPPPERKPCRARQSYGMFPIVAGTPLRLSRQGSRPRKQAVFWECPAYTSADKISASIRYELGVGRPPAPLGLRSRRLLLGPLVPCNGPVEFKVLRRSPFYKGPAYLDDGQTLLTYWFASAVFHTGYGKDPISTKEGIPGSFDFDLTPLGRIGTFRQDFVRWSIRIRVGTRTSTQSFCQVLQITGPRYHRKVSRTVYPGTRCPTTRRAEDDDDRARGLDSFYDKLP